MINLEYTHTFCAIQEACEYLRGHSLIDTKGIGEVFKGLGFPILTSEPNCLSEETPEIPPS
jgi:hypothetical protein